MSAFDKLWMCLYARLGDLCVDPRPAVRKSAGQTLFSTISAHGSLLHQPTWQAVLWQVLFPLLHKVRSLSSSASNEKVDPGGNILIHHSRNTAQKQWAETQVLTLSGVARVFNTKRQLLQMLGDFPRAWSLLLEFVEHSALSKNNEVSLAALKSLQEILYLSKSTEEQCVVDEDKKELWNVAWRVWLNIGAESTAPPPMELETSDDFYIPSQPFLTALIQIFPALFQHIKNRLVGDELWKLCQVLHNSVSIPVNGEYSPFIIPSLSDVVLTPLQDGVLQCMELLQKEALSNANSMHNMIAVIFEQLLLFIKMACIAPQYGNIQAKNSVQQMPPEWTAINYVPFGEKALSMAVKLYLKTAEEEAVIQNQTLEKIIETLRVPLSMKYSCPSPSTWKAAITKLLGILHVGLPLARQHSEHFTGMWPVLAETLDLFLFPKSLPPVEQGLEEMETDEAMDCRVIEQLRDEVLPHAHTIPKEFTLKVVVLLNKGSIHSATHTSSSDFDNEGKLREEFAKTCFETLLQFSLLDKHSSGNECENAEGGIAGRLAVTALLHRFQDVLRQFVEEERCTGKCPLPRYRLAEISFVLKAVATLVMSLKKAPAGKVDRSSWEQLIGLYPYLVNCTSTSSPQVLQSLREALLQFSDLVQPPCS